MYTCASIHTDKNALSFLSRSFSHTHTHTHTRTHTHTHTHTRASSCVFLESWAPPISRSLWPAPSCPALKGTGLAPFPRKPLPKQIDERKRTTPPPWPVPLSIRF